MCTSPPPQPPNCRPNENYYAPETAHLALITHLVQESSKTQAQRQIKSRLQHITGVGLRTIWSLSLKKSRGKGERREDVKMTWKSSLMSELQWQNSNDCFRIWQRSSRGLFSIDWTLDFEPGDIGVSVFRTLVPNYCNNATSHLFIFLLLLESNW